MIEGNTALKTYAKNQNYHDHRNNSRSYRTKNKAGEIVEMPEKYSIISHKEYKNAIGLHQDPTAYLQPIIMADGLEYNNGELVFNSLPTTKAVIKDFFTNKIPEGLDLPLLRAFYSIILNAFEINKQYKRPQPKVITVYLPSLMRYMGKKNTSRNEAIGIIKDIYRFNSIIGVIGGNILPVLVFMGEDRDKNTISFSSPYMNKVIESTYNLSRISTNRLPMEKKNSRIKKCPTHSYLVKPSICNERNKTAVEIVVTVAVLIEQAGNSIPHISARTIVENNLLLSSSLQGSSTADKNKKIKRAFRKAWELLQTQTLLKETYTDILLPDPQNPRNIPTTTTLDMVFRFPHKGKHKNKT